MVAVREAAEELRAAAERVASGLADAGGTLK
jgi:hypothetical protein